jgi:hypothetical protein
MYKNTYELIKNIKNKFPTLDIAAGGAHASTLREDLLNED